MKYAWLAIVGIVACSRAASPPPPAPAIAAVPAHVPPDAGIDAPPPPPPDATPEPPECRNFGVEHGTFVAEDDERVVLTGCVTGDDDTKTWSADLVVTRGDTEVGRYHALDWSNDYWGRTRWGIWFSLHGPGRDAIVLHQVWTDEQSEGEAVRIVAILNGSVVTVWERQANRIVVEDNDQTAVILEIDDDIGRERVRLTFDDLVIDETTPRRKQR